MGARRSVLLDPPRTAVGNDIREGVRHAASGLKHIKRLMAIDASSSHDKIHLLGGGDIGNRVPGHRDEISLFTGSQHADVVPL